MILLGILLAVLGRGCPSAIAAEMALQPERERITAGVAAFHQGDYPAAIAAFNAAIRENPNSAVAYGDRCLVRIYQREYAEAIADCTQALRLDPRNTEAYLNRGLAHYRRDEPDAAIADFTHLLSLTPHDPRARYNRGLAKVAQAAYREAIVDYGEALRQAPPQDHQMLGQIYTDRGLAELLESDRQGASVSALRSSIADFTQAIQLDDHNARAYLNRACAYHRDGNLVAALSDFDRAIQIDSTYAEAYFGRAMVRRQRGEAVGAIADLRESVRYFGEHPELAPDAYRQAVQLLKQWRSQTSIG
ncbi:MAG: hypothetical protein Fur0046_36740 [Cyanobacteria bacterium J069]